MPVKITTRVGHLSDPRIHKNANGSYSAKGVRGTFSTWLAAFEAMDDQHRRDLKELQNFHK
ncbi:MAG: hypothetical protein IPL32_18725 [Chloracidobacterium sp.]|nr:hypothetical protein [Chloracidobacterium sp.]